MADVIPGVVATQHSGEGKANQYFLRGFILNHGTDFSTSVDGAPANLRTHGHGQGYLDLNFVVPDLIECVDFRKGPYRASTRDFSAAGSARYSIYNALERNFVKLAHDTSLLLALEAEQHEGP